MASIGLGIHPGHQIGMATRFAQVCQPAAHTFEHPCGAGAVVLDPEWTDPDPQAEVVTTTAMRSTIARRCQGFEAAIGFVGGALAPIRS
jgi:hypothetical protein